MALRDDQSQSLRGRADNSYALIIFVGLFAALALLVALVAYSFIDNPKAKRTSAPAANQSDTDKTKRPGASKQPVI
jgi:peptidoglycan/LPS O-acetylase OafA/YrhL